MKKVLAYSENGLGSIPIHNYDGSQYGVLTADKKCAGSGLRVSLNRGVEKSGEKYLLRKCIFGKCTATNIELDIIVRPIQKKLEYLIKKS